MLSKLCKRFRVLLALHNSSTDTNTRLTNKNIRRILVLCYGNIYRSPLVAQYLCDKLGEKFEVRSAGFHPKSDRPSPEAHVKMCADYQLDLSCHRSTVINRELVDWADAIVIMDKHNWYTMVDYGASALSKVVWLGTLLATKDREIEDPYNKSLEEKKKIIDQLFSASHELVARLS